MEVTGRFFVVGSARSGTTLLQAMVAAHPRVFSIPETHFFCESAASGRRGRLGMVRKRWARKALEYVLQMTGQENSGIKPPRLSPFLRSYAKRFVWAMDAAAVENGRDIWAEKTPHHIGFLQKIADSVQGARFIHVLRDGRDVLASQRHAMRQDPEYWSAHSWSLEDMVQLWNDNTRITLDHAGSPGHLVISYEELILTPEEALRQVAEFMGMDFDDAMLRHWEVADRVLGRHRDEPWMTNTHRAIKDTRGEKFRSVFAATEREFITANLIGGGDPKTLLMSALAVA